MNKQEIIEKLKKLLDYPALEVEKDVKNLEKEYKKIWTEEFEEAKQAFIDEGGKAKDFIYPKSTEDEKITELIMKFEKKRELEEKQLEQLQEENKKKKEELINQLETLADADIQNITTVVKKLREIQNEWKEIKELKKSDYANLQRKYNTLLDKINDNIRAFSVLQQYDLQKNTELKEKLLQKFESLLSLEDAKKVDELFKLYKKEWNQIGNVVNKKHEEIKIKYHEITTKIKDKLNKFYEILKEERRNNLERKKQLLLNLKSITKDVATNQNVVWKDMNEKIQQIKSEWEKIGHVPAEFTKKINDEYNALLDIYYASKRKHQELISKKQDEIKAKKEKILDELKTLKDSKEFDKTSKRIKELQKEWNRFRLKNKEEDDKLNQQFRDYCNIFFENKKNNEREKIQQEKDNLIKKLELIHKLKTTEFDKNKPENALQKIQEFIKEWNSIGHVPIEEKDKIYDEFYGKINQLYAELQIDEYKKHSIQYKTRIQQLLQESTNPVETLTKEEKFIKRKITELENEITQIDNHLNFFKNANPDNPLLKNTYQKKEKINSQINEWKIKLNIVKGTLSDMRKSQQTAQ